MSKRDIDVFIKNTKDNPGYYGEKGIELAKKAKEMKICPCSICTLTEIPELCARTPCYPWYTWFRRVWKSIQADAKEKGWGK
jgi:hypothetical protein